MRANWFEEEKALQRILERQLAPTYARARPRLSRMGELAANEVSLWADQADHQGPRLLPYDRSGSRIDEIDYHPSYRKLQQVAYGEGIVAATHDPAMESERGARPRALTFGLGYVFAQGELGLFCPVCMTDGAASLLKRFAPPALRDRFLPRLAARGLDQLFTGAMFLTEKEGGSDVGQAQAVARGEGDVVQLFGNKWFCSNADADVIMILARPEGAGAGTRGLGLYLLPRVRADGSRNAYRIDRIKDKLGVRSMPTGEVTLEGAEAYLIGGPGVGFNQMAQMLNLSRMYNGVSSVAVMRRSLNEALAWARSRVAFGKKVIEHPLMQETLLDLAAEQRGALAWAFRGVELLDRVDAGEATALEKQSLRMLTPMLKAYLGKKSVWAASEAVEALGGNGYIEDWPMARVFRDAQVLPIWEGTTHVLTLDTFRAIRKENAQEGFFGELEPLLGELPSSLQSRVSPLVDELGSALKELATDAGSEHVLWDWISRAAVLWQVGLLGSKRSGAGTPADLRAASRLLARNVPTGLLRKDRATLEDVEAVAFS